jgi:hypothetical protein
VKLKSELKSSASMRPLVAAPIDDRQDDLREPEFVDELVIERVLGVPVKTLRNWRVSGRGPPFCKFGASVRYHLATARTWAFERQRESTSETA